MNWGLRVRSVLPIVEKSGSRSKESGSKYVPCTQGKRLAEGMEAHAYLIIALFSGFDVQFSP